MHPMHLRSEPYLMRKPSVGPFLSSSSKNLITFSSPSSQLTRNGSRISINENLAAKTFSLSTIFPNSFTILTRKTSKQREANSNLLVEDVLEPSTTISQPVASLENSFACGLIKTNKPKRVDVTDLNEAILQKEEEVDALKKEVEKLFDEVINKEAIVSRNKHEKEQIEKSLRKKELVIQIYEKLIRLCAKAQAEPKSNESQIKHEENNRFFAHRNTECLKVRRILTLGEVLTNNNSLYNPTTHKNSYFVLNKSSGSDGNDMSLNFKNEDIINQKEGDFRLMLVKRTVNKGQINCGSLHLRHRNRKVTSAYRKKKSVLEFPDRPQPNSDIINKSNSSLSLKKGNSNLSILVGNNSTILHASTINPKSLRKKNLNDVITRFEKVCEEYQKANKHLFAQIDDLEIKIKDLQTNKI